MESYIRELEALLKNRVERFTFSRHFVFPYNGDEMVFTPQARTFLEGALNCTIIEEEQGAAPLIILRIPESARDKAQKYLSLYSLAA